MAVRTSMNALIASIRTFIGDAAGANAVFTDDQIQEALDARRRRVSTQELCPETLYAPGGSSLYISGRQYDVYGSAADVLDSWLALAQTEFDFLELGSTFKRGQQSPAIEQTIKRYRRKQWLRTTPLIRDDELPGWYA
jgi:hypothetical protein